MEEEKEGPVEGCKLPFSQDEITEIETGKECSEERKNEMLKFLVQSLGTVSYAAQKAGVPRSLHYYWLKTDEKYKASVDLINEMAVDFAENRLFKKIQDEEWKAIMYLFRTRGRNRGYSLYKETKAMEDFIINFIVKNPEVAEMIKHTKKEL